jgi:hypothetical protein
MKKFYLFISLLLIGFSSWSQCTPDTSITHNDPGVYPDSAAGLPHAVAGQPYSTTMQIKVLTDTVVVFGGIPVTATIDSIVLNNITGLPSGFTFSCTPAGCSFPGGSDACAQLVGNPTIGMVGSYPLVVQTTAYATVFGTPQSASDNNNDYTLVIDSTTGITILDKSGFTIGQNEPNPAQNYTNVPVVLSRPETVSVTVSNLIGKKVISKVYSLQKGRNTVQIDLHELQPGIYLYTFSDGRNTVTRRMIISNN